MALTPTELLGAAAFPLMLLAATAALASILYSRGSQMDPDDWMAVALVSTHRATAVASRVVADSHTSNLLAGSSASAAQASVTVVAGASFHMLPTQQGSVGTSALMTMLPFGSLGVLCCHLIDSAAQAIGVGALATRLALSPLIVYTVYSAWTKLLGGAAIGWNLLLCVSLAPSKPVSSPPPARLLACLLCLSRPRRFLPVTD